MKFKNIKNYENYKLYENGSIFNAKTNKYLTLPTSQHQSRIKLTKNGKLKGFTLERLIYENVHDTKLNNNEIIIHVDNDKNNFYWNNLKKIDRTDMFKKEIIQELDKNKEWTNVKNYPDYKISNYGDIFSVKSNKMLSPTKDCQGYFNVKLILKNKRKSFKIHRLVYDAFKKLSGNDNLVIDHIDRNPSNNYINNLREVSKNENSLNINFVKQRTNKITQCSLDGKFIKKWESLNDVRNNLKINIKNIILCCSGKMKEYNGYIWISEDFVKDTSDYIDIKTDDGNKYSKYKINKNGIIINEKNIILKTSLIYGYKHLSLIGDNKKRKLWKVHRLVAITFIDNSNNYEMVNHIDRNKLNNNIENLEWVNHKQNITHACGKKINQIDIKTNKIIKTHDSVCDAYRELNKTYGANIRWACEGKRKSAFGHKWSFVN